MSKPYTMTIQLSLPPERAKDDIIGLVVGSDSYGSVNMNAIAECAQSEYEILCMLAKYLSLPAPTEVSK